MNEGERLFEQLADDILQLDNAIDIQSNKQTYCDVNLFDDDEFCDDGNLVGENSDMHILDNRYGNAESV